VESVKIILSYGGMFVGTYVYQFEVSSFIQSSDRKGNLKCTWWWLVVATDWQ